MENYTRFRAYQLGEKGASFSLSVDNDFTLIEARLNSVNGKNVIDEMRKVGAQRISLLHITSWDEDHCKPDELKFILEQLKPQQIHYPGYMPDTDCGKSSLSLILNYLKQNRLDGTSVTPRYVNSLEPGESAKFSTVIYNPTKEYAKHNDMSTAALFRKGRFTVLSFGDCESPDIAKSIMGCAMASKETDVMLMAHHGADNGFTTEDFIKAISPSVAICASDYDNQYDHPRQEIRELLYENKVNLYTTKTGDVLIECGADNNVHVTNFRGNSSEVSSTFDFRPKFTVNP